MSILVHVALLSGQTVSIPAEPAESVWKLRHRVQRFLHIGICALINSSCIVLKENVSIQESGLTDGSVTAMASKVQLLSRRECKAFALIRPDGSVMAWGASRSICKLPKSLHAQQIAASVGAFAAVCSDGNVVSWGEPWAGSDSSAVHQQLRSVRAVTASGSAFCCHQG